MVDGNVVAAASLVREFMEDYPDQAAAALEDLAGDEAVEVLTTATPENAAAMIEHLRPDVAVEVFVALPEGVRTAVIGRLDPAKCSSLLARVDGETRRGLLSGIDARIATEIEALLTYPDGTAGSIMDVRVVVAAEDSRAETGLGLLRRHRDLRINNIYVTDREGMYLGRVPLQDLAIADPDQPLSALVTEPPVAVLAAASQSEVVEVAERHHLRGLPVVDVNGRLLGLIRNEALVEAVEQEASVDIQTMVGASRDERALSPVSFAVRKRLPWLQVNLLTAFLASFVVGMFEDTIARFTALAVLLPVVAGQSGNTGAQALAVTMRGLALREIRVRHALRVAIKESLVGAVNGVAVAVVTSAAVYVWSRSAGLAAVIGIAMVMSMVIAGLSGAVIPIVLSVLGQDPAQASSIVLTTVTDVMGFLSFLGLATLAASAL